MLPIVALAGALWYLSRPERNPDWITTGGKHRPLRSGDGRAGDPTPYDDAKLSERWRPTGATRTARTAASPDFKAPESEAELRGEAKRLYARYKQATSEFETAERETTEATARSNEHNAGALEDEKTVPAAINKALAAQETVKDRVSDAVGLISPRLYDKLNIRVRPSISTGKEIVATYPYLSDGYRQVMDADNAAQLVPDLQAWQKALTQAIGMSDSKLAVSMGLIPEATFRGAELRSALEKTRDKIPAIIKAARAAITAAAKARDAKANQREYGKGAAAEASATAWKRYNAILSETQDLERRLEELTGHRVYSGAIQFESRASRDRRLKAEAAWQAEVLERAVAQQKQREQAAAEKERSDRAMAQAAERYKQQRAEELAAQKAKTQAAAAAREARLARATAKDLDRLKAQANELAAKHNEQAAVARQWAEDAERSGAQLTRRGNYESASARRKANVAAAKAREYEVRYRELERAIAAIESTRA
jgi:hypothetical protein